MRPNFKISKMSLIDLEYVSEFSLHIHWSRRFQITSKILISCLFYRNKVVSLVSIKSVAEKSGLKS